MLYQDPAGVQTLVKEKGLFSFYRDGRGKCCGVRKVAPCAAKSKSLTPGLRVNGRIKVSPAAIFPSAKRIQISPVSSAQRQPSALIKFNPKSEWTPADIWNYIRKNEVPYNAPHDQGFYPSAAAYAHAVLATFEHERAGRRWLEEATKKECGLHSQNIINVAQA